MVAARTYTGAEGSVVVFKVVVSVGAYVGSEWDPVVEVGAAVEMVGAAVVVGGDVVVV